MVIELWGGPQDGKVIEVPDGTLEIRVPTPTQWTSMPWTPDMEEPLAFKVGIYEATSRFSQHGGVHRLYRWTGVH